MTLLQKLLAWLNGRHTIEDALTHFNHAISKLEAFIDQERKNVANKVIDIAQAQADKALSERNAFLASGKLKKLRSLIGDDDDDDDLSGTSGSESQLQAS